MNTEHDSTQIYVVDAENRPLAVLPVKTVHDQNLRHRGFLLVLTDGRNRLALRRLAPDHPSFPGRWDVPGSGHVGIDEAADEAAMRALPAALREHEPDLYHRLHLANGAGTGNEAVDVFEARIPEHLLHHFADSLEYLLVDHDEFHALLSAYKECLTPDLAAVRNARLHRPSGA